MDVEYDHRSLKFSELLKIEVFGPIIPIKYLLKSKTILNIHYTYLPTFLK